MKLLLKKTYLSFIKGAVGSKSYQSNFARIKGKDQDILNKGQFSCAFFVSSVLKTFSLLSDLHTTVNGTVLDMKRNGWKLITKPRPGSVILWEEKQGNKHLGFYIGNNKAVSNCKTKFSPCIHHWTYGIQNHKPKRKVEKIFWHNCIKN